MAKNIAIRLTDTEANRMEYGYKSLHAYARSAIDSWHAVRKAAIKSLRRKDFTLKQRESLRALRPGRGAGRGALMVLAHEDKSLHSKLMMLTEIEGVVLADLIRNRNTRLLNGGE